MVPSPNNRLHKFDRSSLKHKRDDIVIVTETHVRVFGDVGTTLAPCRPHLTAPCRPPYCPQLAAQASSRFGVRALPELMCATCGLVYVAIWADLVVCG
jgi:hypothetical protein